MSWIDRCEDAFAAVLTAVFIPALIAIPIAIGAVDEYGREPSEHVENVPANVHMLTPKTYMVKGDNLDLENAARTVCGHGRWDEYEENASPGLGYLRCREDQTW